jgi:hypothetical protein
MLGTEVPMSTNAGPGADRRGEFWKGVVVGAAAVVLLVVLVMAGMMAFGRCPMCGRGMMGGMGDSGFGATTLQHGGESTAMVTNTAGPLMSGSLAVGG